jgi:hypothetical protein
MRYQNLGLQFSKIGPVQLAQDKLANKQGKVKSKRKGLMCLKIKTRLMLYKIGNSKKILNQNYQKNQNLHKYEGKQIKLTEMSGKETRNKFKVLDPMFSLKQLYMKCQMMMGVLKMMIITITTLKKMI